MSFFHNKSRAKARRNRIDMLKVDGNNWCFDQEHLRKAAMEYFEDLFTKEIGELPQFQCRGKFLNLSVEEKDSLAQPILPEQEKNVVLEMGPSKAGGDDGLNAFFFQNQWSVVGNFIVGCYSEKD